MPRLFHAFVTTWLLATLSAQEPAPESPNPLELVTRAEALLKQKETEDAILELWEAQHLLMTLPESPVNVAAWLSTRHLLLENDPLETTRRGVFTSVARQQLELATAYRGKKWLDVAATRVAVADRYDRELGQKERAALAAAVAAAAKAKPKPAVPATAAKPAASTEALSLLRRENALQIIGTFLDIADGVEVPAHPSKRETSFHWLTRSRHADHEVSVEFRSPEPNKSHNAALCIAHSVSDTKLDGVRVHCEYYPTEKVYTVTAWAVTSNIYKEIAHETVKPTASPDDWHRIATRVHGTSMQVVFDNAVVMSCTAVGPLQGMAGVSTGLQDVASATVQFRRLRIDPLPADQPDDAEVRKQAAADDQNAIAAAVDEAKDLLTKKQPEPASLRLREAMHRVNNLPDGVLRDTLRKTVETMLNQADPIAAKRAKAAQTISAELVTLADEYKKVGQVRAALAMTIDAAAFDTNGLVDRVTAAREAVQAWNVAQATARAADLAPPTDDGTALREWFAAGRRLARGSVGLHIEGASAKANGLLPEEFATWQPRPLAPKLSKAFVHIHLLAAGTTAGLMFDVVDETDYAIAIVHRRKNELRLAVHRYAARKWNLIGSKTVPLDRWRFDAWHPLEVRSGETEAVITLGTVELKLARRVLGKPTGLFGLYAGNDGSEPADVELRAFRGEPTTPK